MNDEPEKFSDRELLGTIAFWKVLTDGDPNATMRPDWLRPIVDRLEELLVAKGQRGRPQGAARFAAMRTMAAVSRGVSLAQARREEAAKAGLSVAALAREIRRVKAETRLEWEEIIRLELEAERQ